jgi:RNA polymerase sigma-70 factor (ECF subfamily)
MDIEKGAVIRLKKGDIQGLEFLVNKYYFQALRSSFFITLDFDRSEDIVQTVFLRLNVKIKQFDLNRPFRPWLMRTVINASLDDLKMNKNYFYIEEIEANNSLLSFEKMIDSSILPENLTENAELKEAIWNALKKISPNQRSVVVMHYYLDMNETEMSSELNAPKSSIKWWLRSSRQLLRKFLQSFANLDK